MAEGEGIVKFQVDVDNGYFEVLINDTLWLQQYRDTLPAGRYEAKVWSPGYMIYPIDFEITEGEVTEKLVSMVYSNEKQKFESDYKKYRMDFHKSFTLPASLSLGITLWTGYHMIRSYDLRKKGLLEIERYDETVISNEIDVIKANVSDINRRYNLNRSMYYVGSGLTVGAWLTSVYLYKRFKKNNKEPVFTPQSPWKDRFSMSITPFGCGMTLRI